MCRRYWQWLESAWLWQDSGQPIGKHPRLEFWIIQLISQPSPIAYLLCLE